MIIQAPYFAARRRHRGASVSTYGQRLRRGVEVAIGVTVGVALGDLWLFLFGTGTWQIMLVVAIAMSLATLLGAGPLMMTQAGVQSIAVIVLAPRSRVRLRPLARRGDRLRAGTVGGDRGAERPAPQADRAVAPRWSGGMAETLEAAADALRQRRRERAPTAVLDRARAAEKDLAAFDEAAAEGLAVVRHSLFRRRQLSTCNCTGRLPRTA